MSWYDDALQTRDFANVLVQAEAVEDVSVVLAKPYKFTNEFLLWKRLDFPEPDEENWDAFVESLETEDEEGEE